MSTEPKAPARNILIPKTIGILNIVFGFVLLGCGTCYTFYVPGLASLGTIVKARQQEELARREAKNKVEIEALKQQEKAAETEADKEQIRAARAALEASGKTPIIDLGFNNYGFDDPRVMGHFVLDASSGMLLNLVMVISGFGLLALKEWARKLAIWLGSIKVIRLLFLCLSLLFMVNPIIVRKATAFLQTQASKADEQAQGQEKVGGMSHQTAVELGRSLNTMLIAYALGPLVVGSIYPILAIILLTRPSALAACAPARSAVPRSE
jgi:hypothetical protein